MGFFQHKFPQFSRVGHPHPNLGMIMRVLLFLFIFTFQAQAESLVKSCKTTLSFPGETTKIPTEIKVFEKEANLYATVTQTQNGFSNTVEELVIFDSGSVRANLDPYQDDLNFAESAINHAISITSEIPYFSAGFDLKEVTFAKVYTIGAMGNMGGTLLVEGYDAQGNNLGTFLGGFLVFPCL